MCTFQIQMVTIPIFVWNNKQLQNFGQLSNLHKDRNQRIKLITFGVLAIEFVWEIDNFKKRACNSSPLGKYTENVITRRNKACEERYPLMTEQANRICGNKSWDILMDYYCKASSTEELQLIRKSVWYKWVRLSEREGQQRCGMIPPPNTVL